MALPRESLSRLPGKTDRVLIGRGDARCHEHAPQHSGPKRRDRDPGVNEAAGLERSVTRLRGFVADELHYATQITIADNASTDATLETALRLADSLDGVGVLHLDAKGRGRALRAAWGRSGAEVLAYMDVDLSTDLRHLRELVEPCLDGDVDIAIGSRLARGARVSRGVKRELISRSYNAILKGALTTDVYKRQVHPLDDRDHLPVGLVLCRLLDPGVDVADDRLDVANHLALSLIHI